MTASESGDCGFNAGDLWDWFDRGDADVTDATRVEEHLETCPQCQIRLREMQGLHGALESLGTEQDWLPESIGPYRIERIIGHGGMGVVYEGRQTTPARSVAVKVMRSCGEPGEHRLRAFRREIEALGRLNHPSIATVHDAGRTSDGLLYLVMELVHGESIDSFCDRTGAGIRQRVALVAQIADAVYYAHRQGVVHRDLKPGNLFVDEAGRTRILDFGLARFLDPDHDVTRSSTLPGEPCGTLPYMSPEQLRGDPVTEQSDVYALGVLLYQLLTKSLPYGSHRSVPDMQRVLQRTDPKHPASVVSVAREIGDVAMKAIERDCSQRYASADEFAVDLRNFLDGKSVRAHPPSVAYRARLLARRYWRPTVVASIVVTSLTTALWPRTDVPAPRSERFKIPGGISSVPQLPKDFDFTRDGSRGVFVRARRNQIIVWHKENGATEAILQAPDQVSYFHPSWSPDESSIAFLESRWQSESSRVEKSVLVMDLDTRVARRIYRPTRPSKDARACRWLPNGAGLLCQSFDRSLFSVTLDGKSTRWPNRFRQDRHRIGHLGAFSPDGKWVLVDMEERLAGSNEIANSNICCLPFGGGDTVQLTFGQHFDRHAVWHPDGSVWFVSDRPSGDSPRPALNLWRVAVSRNTGRPESDPAPMTFDAAGNKVYPQFLNDGTDIVYRVGHSIPQIGIAKTDGHRFVQKKTLKQGSEPVIAPDARTIYHLDPTTEPGLLAVDRMTRNVRRITDDACVARRPIGLPRYSLHPDGSRIVYARKKGAVFELCVVSTADEVPADPIVVDTADAMPTRPCWSPDGKWIAYAAGGALRVVSADGIARRTLDQLWQWHSVFWSPQGDALAGLGYLSPETQNTEGIDVITIFVVTFPDGERTPITDAVGYKEGLRWHPHGEFLTYLHYGPSSQQIRRAYPDGRPTELMIDQPDHCEYLGDWSPDGRLFLFRSWGLTPENDCPARLHVWDSASRRVIDHGAIASFPGWSGDGKTVAWSDPAGTLVRYFEVLRGIARRSR